MRKLFREPDDYMWHQWKMELCWLEQDWNHTIRVWSYHYFYYWLTSALFSSWEERKIWRSRPAEYGYRVHKWWDRSTGILIFPPILHNFSRGIFLHRHLIPYSQSWWLCNSGSLTVSVRMNRIWRYFWVTGTSGKQHANKTLRYKFFQETDKYQIKDFCVKTGASLQANVKFMGVEPSANITLAGEKTAPYEIKSSPNHIIWITTVL